MCLSLSFYKRNTFSSVVLFDFCSYRLPKVMTRTSSEEFQCVLQPIVLVLLDIPPMVPVLEGVVMELQDCALPLLRGGSCVCVCVRVRIICPSNFPTAVWRVGGQVGGSEMRLLIGCW